MIQQPYETHNAEPLSVVAGTSNDNSASNDNNDSELDILARTIYGEARGEPVRGQEAVGAVVINRVKRAVRAGGRYWWGHDISSVCLKPWQFSCWNENDPNRERILHVNEANKTFRQCLRVARRCLAGTFNDPTNGATHYHTHRVCPVWARGKSPAKEIGGHLFYNNIDLA